MGKRLRTRCLRWEWWPTRYSTHTYTRTHSHTPHMFNRWSNIYTVFFTQCEAAALTLTVYLLGWCLWSWPAGSYSWVRGRSTTTTDRKIPCAASVRSVAVEKAVNTVTSFHSTSFLVLWLLFPHSRSFSLLYPNHPDVCVRPGELPGSLHWDQRRVYECVRHGNGQGALPARRLWAVSSLCTYSCTYTPTCK